MARGDTYLLDEGGEAWVPATSSAPDVGVMLTHSFLSQLSNWLIFGVPLGVSMGVKSLPLEPL